MLITGLLRLRERRLVLKHLEKLEKNMDKAKENSSIKVPKGVKTVTNLVTLLASF